MTHISPPPRLAARWAPLSAAQASMLLLALAMLAGASPGWAAESFAGMGGAFRPSAAPPSDAVVALGSTPRSADNLAGLRLVLSGAGRALASIDGHIVRVGDTVNGMRVLQINPQGVLLAGEDGARERLEMNPLAVKRQRPAPARGSLHGVGQ